MTLTGNSEDIIADALRSVVAWVDRVLVVDTGVTDATLDIARDIARDKLVLRQFPWRDDFAAARNFALDAAAELGAGWAVTLDTDERLDLDGLDIREALSATSASALHLRHAGGTYGKERFFRLPARGRYVGPTHEAFIRDGGGSDTLERGTFAEVAKTPERYRQKAERDVAILTRHTAEHPDDPRWFYYLGDSLSGLGRHDEAIAAFRVCASLDGWDEEGAWAMYRAAESFLKLGRAADAVACCAVGMARHAGLAELPWLAAYASWQLGRPAQAIYWARASVALGYFAGTGASVPRIGFRHPPALWEGPFDVLRFALRAIGDEAGADEAERTYREAMAARQQAGGSSDDDESALGGETSLPATDDLAPRDQPQATPEVQGEARVGVVLINYKRPENVRKIVQAFREQTVPCRISLIDAAAGPEFALDPDVRAAVDVVYSWNRNFGPYNRYVPIAAFDQEFTYFQDDDMLPGSRLIEHFLKVADSAQSFGVLGQQGRRVLADGAYDAAEVPRTDQCEPVDIVVRGYFVRTRHLPAVVELRNTLNLAPDESLEDDLLLCTAMNMIHGLTNYVTPLDADPETRMNKTELDASFSRYRRKSHYQDRTEFCRKVMAIGWAPLAARAQNGDNGTPSAPRSAKNGRDFDVNAYWLKRGKSYISEGRLFTEPYLLQEEFIVDSIRNHGLPLGRILEIGCGFGRITKRLAEAFPEARIVAVDLSPDQLQNAREYCAAFQDRIEFLEYDIYANEPLPGGRYDAAIAVEVLLHHPQEVVLRLLKDLSQVADTIVNYDWSEDYSGPIAPHVWVHDYRELYRRLELNAEVVVEPRTHRGQQQKLFIASRLSTAVRQENA